MRSRPSLAIALRLTLAAFAALALTGNPQRVAHAAGPGPLCPNPPAVPAANRPAVQLNRTRGPVGTDLLASVSGWQPGTHVTLAVVQPAAHTGTPIIAKPIIASGTVGADGSVALTAFNAEQSMCTDWGSPSGGTYSWGQPGTSVQFVALGDDGEVSAPATFTYLTPPSLSIMGQRPGTGYGAKPGETLAVRGADWEPNETVTLILTDHTQSVEFDSVTGLGGEHIPTFAPLLPVTAVTDAHGAFAAPITLPATLPWGHNAILSATGTGPLYGALASTLEVNTLPLVTPTFALSQTYALPGKPITITGDHWNPGETVMLDYCRGGLHNDNNSPWPYCVRGSEQQLGTATIDAQGHLSQQVIIPANARLGIITIEVKARFTGRTGVAVSVVSHPPTWTDEHPQWTAAIAVGGVLLMLLLPVALVAFLSRRERGAPAPTEAA